MSIRRGFPVRRAAFNTRESESARIPSRRAPVVALLSIGAVLAIGGATACAPGDDRAISAQPSSTNSSPRATRVAAFTAVRPVGVPLPGFSVEDTGRTVMECTRWNPSQLGPAPSSCQPNSLAAYLCWDSPGSVLCLADALDTTLRRYGLTSSVKPPANASMDGVPTRLTLSSGERCGIRLGSDQGQEPIHPSLRGLTVAFYCGTDGLMVWGPQTWQRREEVIDKSTPVWSVRVAKRDAAPHWEDVEVAEFAVA